MKIRVNRISPLVRRIIEDLGGSITEVDRYRTVRYGTVHTYEVTVPYRRLGIDAGDRFCPPLETIQLRCGCTVVYNHGDGDSLASLRLERPCSRH